jgi:hypothetical protein
MGRTKNKQTRKAVGTTTAGNGFLLLFFLSPMLSPLTMMDGCALSSCTARDGKDGCKMIAGFGESILCFRLV